MHEHKPGNESDGAACQAAITFHGTDALRRAMRAVRAIMKNRRRTGGTGPCCRLMTNAATGQGEVLATDGRRAAAIRIAERTTRAGDTMDAALGIDVVRAIIAARAPRLRIETTADERIRLIEDGENAHRPLFAPAKALEATVIKGPIEREQPGAAIAAVNRCAALHALRTMPAQESETCRLAVSRHGGLRAWAHDRRRITPGEEADAVLANLVARANGQVVLGISRAALTETLRTLHGRRLDIVIARDDTPILIASTDGLERVVIATSRLG